MYPEYPAPPNQPNPEYSGAPNPYAPNPQYPGAPNPPNPYAPTPQQYPPASPPYAPTPANPSYPGAPNPQYTPPSVYPPNYAPSGPQAPSGVYGAPPTSPAGSYPPFPPTPPQRRTSPLPIILSIVGAYFALKPGNPSTNINPTATTAVATATLAPTATSTPSATSATYTENIPACDNPNNWTVDSSQVKCGSTAMTLTDPANSHTISQASFNGTGAGFAFTASYDVSVNLSNLKNACAGMLVLAASSNNAAIGVYLCADGGWFVTQYSASGAGKTLQSGGSGSVALGDLNVLDVTITPSQIQVTAEAKSLTTISRTDTLTTSYIALVVAGANAANVSSADFDTFSYAAINS